VKLPAATIHCLQEAALKGFTGSLMKKQLLAVIPTADHVVNRSGIFYPWLSGHNNISPLHYLTLSIFIFYV